MELDTTHRRPSRWLLPMLAAAVLSPLLLIPASMLERTAPGTANVLGILGLAGIFLGFAGALVSARARQKYERVVFGHDGIRLGQTLIPRADIGDAVLVPATRSAKAYVEVRGRSGGVLTCVDVGDDARGKEALHALGLGAAEKVATFSCLTARESFTTKMSLGLVALGLVFGGLVFLLNAPWLFAAMVPMWLEAGGDARSAT